MPIVLRKTDKNEKHLAARQRLLALTQAQLHRHHIHPAAEFHANGAHGAETKVWGDTAYQGQTEASRAAAPAAQDMTQRRAARGHPLSAEERAKNATKSRVRAKGEHPLLIIKR
ncbi:MAG: IS5/IS1182 family transposase, partial [Alphaproteobacteria bacterium]